MEQPPTVDLTSQSGLLQVFAKTNADGVAFGYGNSNQFGENMRITGNGNLGLALFRPRHAYPLARAVLNWLAAP